MKLLFLVNGNAKKILDAHSFLSDDFKVIKIDEKSLAKPKKILNEINGKYSEVYFGCISLEFQRFIPFMLIYILFSNAKKGGVIDEEGRKIKFNILRTIFITIPLLILEAIGSMLIVVYSYIYYFIWRKLKLKT